MASDGEKSTEELWRRYDAHMARAVRVTAEGLMFHLENQVKNEPELMLNLLSHGPVERGLDMSHGGAQYYNMCIDGTGIATIADSFAAIAQRVEREHRLTFAEMYEAVKSNFAGPQGEYIRMMLAASERYGGGETLGDHWAKRISASFTDQVNAMDEVFAPVKFIPGWFSWSNTIVLGKEVGATPNGRRDGEPINHGANPHPGFRRDGALTAMTNSICAIQPGYGNTAPVQLELDPGMARGEEAVDKICDYILTLFSKGGTLLNINIINAQQILAANENPDLFRTWWCASRLYGLLLPAHPGVPQARRGPHPRGVRREDYAPVRRAGRRPPQPPGACAKSTWPRFPREERMPFFLMCLLAKMPQTQFLAFREGEQVCGFAYMAVLDGMEFLLFLAVDPALRSRGYGSAILREIAALYPDCKRLVSIERCDAPADNAAQRLRRRQFYLRNGYAQTGYLVELSGQKQEILLQNGDFDPEECSAFFQKYSNGAIASADLSAPTAESNAGRGGPRTQVLGPPVFVPSFRPGHALQAVHGAQALGRLLDAAPQRRGIARAASGQNARTASAPPHGLDAPGEALPAQHGQHSLSAAALFHRPGFIIPPRSRAPGRS